MTPDMSCRISSRKQVVIKGNTSWFNARSFASEHLGDMKCSTLSATRANHYKSEFFIPPGSHYCWNRAPDILILQPIGHMLPRQGNCCIVPPPPPPQHTHTHTNTHKITKAPLSLKHVHFLLNEACIRSNQSAATPTFLPNINSLFMLMYCKYIATAIIKKEKELSFPNTVYRNFRIIIRT